MEMLKKYGSIAMMLAAMLMFTGCFSNDASEDENLIGGGVDGVDPFGLNDGMLQDGMYVPGDNPMSEVDFRSLNAVDIAYTPVYFGYNTSTIPAEEMDKVNALADLMIAEPTFLLQITGHCDERGTIEYNVSLGEYRAQAIREVLIQLGVEPERVKTDSMGEEMPVDPGHNEAAWRLNRRGEFAFYTR